MKFNFKYKKLVSVSISLFVLIFVFYKTTVEHIDIIYTNDLHGRLNILPKIEYYINQKNLDRGRLLLLDAGDFIQGTPESDFFKGESMVELFNAISYTAAVVGNHEFDFGEDNLVKLAQKAKFCFLGSNICDINDNLKPYITNYVVKNVGSVRAGIFGLLTKQARFIIAPQHIKNVEFKDEILTAKNVVDELVNQKVQLIICVSHMGYDEKKRPSEIVNDVLLAKEVPDIDIIIGGHTHRTYRKYIGKMLIVQTGAYGEKFGHLRISVFKPIKKVFRIKNRFISTNKLKDGETLQKIVKKYVAEVSKIFDNPVGFLETDLPHYRDKESPLGNFICDIMVQTARTDFAVTNSGGIRGSLNRGELRYRDIYNICPFDNTIVKTKLTGKDIKEIFEHSVSGKYGILQVSKEVKVVYNLKEPLGSRVKELYIKGKPVVENQIYSVTTNSFLASGGEGYHWFSKISLDDTHIKVRDVIKEHIQTRKVIKEKPQPGRIILLLE
ncbi:MAG: bifunctional metallophosphatase/5'-nucleotidase [Endomicrobia bacterium]|nr:bifunctional metallophosphatase/5'-nucleotidase [Endomicrobiia bacterium]